MPRARSTSFFSPPDRVKQGNDAIVAAFRDRLKKVAGFKVPLPMKNSNNAVVYYLFFASQKDVAQKIIDDIFERLLAESGYAGEPIICMAAQDLPHHKAWGDVTVDLLKRLGMNIDYAAVDWGTVAPGFRF